MGMSTTSLPRRPRATELVAAEVRALMGRHNVTQMQLRDVLGVSQTGVSKRLRGLTPFTADEIGVLAEFFGVEPGELFGRAGGEGSPPPRPDGGLNGQPADALARLTAAKVNRTRRTQANRRYAAAA